MDLDLTVDRDGDATAMAEARRLRALHGLAILDTAAESAFDRFTKIAAQLFQTEMALISFIDSGRQWVKSRIGVDLIESKRIDAICNETIRSDDVLIVPDCTLDPRFAGSPLVRGEPGLRFYAGAPLITAGGERIGALCVLDTKPGWEFLAREADTLRELARSVMVQLELRRQMAALSFQQEMNAAIADTADFQSALNVALTYLGNHVGAGFCLVSQACAEPGFMRFVGGVAIDPAFEPVVARELALEKIDLASVSRGQALLEQQPKCDESMTLERIPERFAGKRRFVAAGVRCSFSVPFNIGTLATSVLVCFRRERIGDADREFVTGFVANLSPLLRGRLREQELEQERILIGHANRAMRTLLAANHAVTQAKTEAALAEGFCRVAVEEGGYTTAVVGLAEQDAERSIRYIAAAGESARIMLSLKASWADTPDGNGPSGTAIRENRIVVLRDMQNNPQIAHWRGVAQRTRHDACIAIPLHRGDGSVLGALLLCNTDRAAAAYRGALSFNAEEAELLKELGANLAFGIGAIREQAAHQAARQRQVESEQRLSHLLAASPTVLYALEQDGVIWRVAEITQNIERILGLTVETAMRPGWWDRRVHEEDQNEVLAAQLRVIKGERAVSHYRVARKDGGYCWIRDESVLIPAVQGQPARILGAWLDITEKQEAEAEIHRLAFFDPLTGLPNRRLLLDRLEVSLAEMAGSGESGAVMMLDLDGFKEINDVHGHAAGDRVLAAVGERLRRGLSGGETVARLGGDQFVVLLPRLGSPPEVAGVLAMELAEKLAREIEQPILIDGRPVRVASSIGISLYPSHAVAADEIMRAADTAMYAAKAATRDRAWSGDPSSIAIFEPAMLAVVTHQHQIQAEIRAALAQDRFELWLQRQVDGGGNITGAEALIRLRTEDGRLIQPLEFIPVAEASGLIAPIGQWIIAEAFHLLGSMDARRLPRLAINISAIEFRQQHFVELLLERLRQSDLDPARLTIEITESLLIDRLDETILKLQKLRDHGLRISIDDFGTGYSSLAYLQHMPISEIKIDRRFVSEMLTDPRSAEVTLTLLTVARNLGFEVVAEGVETAEQAAFLRRHGCQTMQGFLFGWPEPVAPFPAEAEILERKAVAF